MKVRCCILVEKVLCYDKCECFSNHFTLMNNHTRNNGSLLRLPPVKLEAAKKSFKYMGAKLWNELPLDIRSHMGKNDFQLKLKHFYVN